MVVNTPRLARRARRGDGYEIRTAAVAMDIPIITTVQELAAAVQGIEALGRGASSASGRPGLDAPRAPRGEPALTDAGPAPAAPGRRRGVLAGGSARTTT